jgi:type II secretory pathway pseudopilin PulG
MRDVGRRGSWTLIELVVVMVILVALAAWLLPRYLGSGKNSAGQTTIQAPLQRAQGVDCQNNLQQLRAAITMSEQTNERFPASLSELRDIPREMLVCPVSKQPYAYDPRSGRVGCLYPAHRGF